MLSWFSTMIEKLVISVYWLNKISEYSVTTRRGTFWVCLAAQSAPKMSCCDHKLAVGMGSDKKYVATSQNLVMTESVGQNSLLYGVHQHPKIPSPCLQLKDQLSQLMIISISVSNWGKIWWCSNKRDNESKMTNKSSKKKLDRCLANEPTMKPMSILQSRPGVMLKGQSIELLTGNFPASSSKSFTWIPDGSEPARMPPWKKKGKKEPTFPCGGKDWSYSLHFKLWLTELKR